jgi:integral membrane protein (TIGR01906 family)
MIENKWVRGILQGVIVLLVLFGLLMAGIRLLMTDAFINMEYNMPYFPEDSYGMTKEQRIRWGAIAVEYLLNDEGIEFLGDLTFDDGTPLYIESELSHMLDVKILTQQALQVWYGALAVLLALGVAAWQMGWLPAYKQMVSRAGLYTIIILATLVLFILLSFNALFTGFHRIFFEGDTWIFRYSDSLIRLFPIRFWQDAFILAGGFTLLGGLGLWLGLRKSTKGNE